MKSATASEFRPGVWNTRTERAVAARHGDILDSRAQHADDLQIARSLDETGRQGAELRDDDLRVPHGVMDVAGGIVRLAALLLHEVIDVLQLREAREPPVEGLDAHAVPAQGCKAPPDVLVGDEEIPDADKLHAGGPWEVIDSLRRRMQPRAPAEPSSGRGGLLFRIGSIFVPHFDHEWPLESHAVQGPEGGVEVHDPFPEGDVAVNTDARVFQVETDDVPAAQQELAGHVFLHGGEVPDIGVHLEPGRVGRLHEQERLLDGIHERALHVLQGEHDAGFPRPAADCRMLSRVELPGLLRRRARSARRSPPPARS